MGITRVCTYFGREPIVQRDRALAPLFGSVGRGLLVSGNQEVCKLLTLSNGGEYSQGLVPAQFPPQESFHQSVSKSPILGGRKVLITSYHTFWEKGYLSVVGVYLTSLLS